MTDDPMTNEMKPNEMKHLSQEQIVLHYYGDAEDEEEIRRHLSECSACRTEFDQVRELLLQIEAAEVPEPPSFFEEKTWLNLRDRLTRQPGGLRGWLLSPQKWGAPDAPRFWAWWGGKWALAGLVTILLVGAFLLGRYGSDRNKLTPANTATPNPQRVVLVAVGDHLERSQILLVEIMNSDTKGTTKDGTKGAVDLSSEQRQARDLLDANHLYRVSAQQAGDPAIAGVLDDLGRVLTEIANGPSQLTPADLEQIRGRIQSQGLLFKIRVVGSQVDSKVRRQEQSQAGGNTI
jgi:hypothetical protein